MARKLASIKQISSIEPIEGKDRIALAMVDGWQVIIDKTQINVGDLVVYCEIDSMMPETEQFEFLRPKKFRIKTMKMSGCISQGICFPLSILPEDIYQIDDDVTEILGVKQYEPTMDKERNTESGGKKYPKFLMRNKLFRKLVLNKKQKSGFPSFISKTDETRIQNAPFYLKEKNEWTVTEKVDGQSGTFFLKKKKSTLLHKLFKRESFDFGVCSRNLRIFKEDKSSYWTVANKYNIKKVLMENIEDRDFIAIQGECVAPNVQGNKYKVTEPDLYVFNVITPNGRMASTTAKIWSENNGLKFVPIIEEHYILPDSVKEVLEYAHGTSKLHNTLREGLVFRSKDGKHSFKAVDPLFLLKHDE